MGTSEAFDDSCTRDEVRPELVDFIRLRMTESRLSIRLLGAATPHLRKSRLHSIVHPDPSKRRPMRLDEAKALCAALGITQWEAAFGTELLESELIESPGQASSFASFMSTVFTGLAPRLATAVAGIAGLDLSDVRPEHGEQLQNLVLEGFERGYAALADRKGVRFNKPETY